ncbi:LPS export ABC transporter periplasmic protein LptC [Candidatus Puniceispirillum sp.]|nr:LPS export ABC transporter periplasmic protein LptC [Candidatus Puniceispirillum sp.]
MTETLHSKRSRLTPRPKKTLSKKEQRLPLSVLLLGLGAVLALAVTSWLGFLDSRKDVSLEIKEVKKAETSEVQLTGARYRGLTPNGKPYEITSVLANEATDGSGRVEMDQPTATVTMQNGSIINLRSEAGVFNKQTDIVTMTGKVIVLQPDKNLQLDTEALKADLRAGEMQSNTPVLVQDIDRRINADSMRVYGNGSRIIFGGAAKMIIRNSNTLLPNQNSPPNMKSSKTNS